MTWRVGLRLLSQGVGMLRKVSEFKDYGGAPLLGLRDLVLVASSESGEPAFENAIRLAATCHRRGLQGSLASAVSAATGHGERP
jgi:glycerol-3-phosphate acyltransferase PlsX